MNYLLIGAAGYIAPRHMKAIKETGGRVVAALDVSDSVGIIDSYFPESLFFKSESIHKIKNELISLNIDYAVICTPNHLHDTYIEQCIKYLNCNVICEKPLTISSHVLKRFKQLEIENGVTISTILQLRLHGKIKALKKQIDASNRSDYKVGLKYVTFRGDWYSKSWKGDINKSGGICFNIGIHLFDMLIFLFGDVQGFKTHEIKNNYATGVIELQKANVDWMLSTDKRHLPNGKNTFRQITVDGNEIEFSQGFTELHTKSYLEILQGQGFGIEESSQSIKLVNQITKHQNLHQ